MTKLAHVSGGVIDAFPAIDPVLAKDGFTLSDCVHADYLAACVEVDDAAAVGWATADGGRTFAAPAVAAPPLTSMQDALSADIDRQAEAQRTRYVTGGSGQAMVYLQKQTQAAQALAGLAASPAMTADQGRTAFALLAAEVGITVDPSNGAAAVDVFGVARAVAATVQRWLPIAAAIEGVRLAAKRAIGAAATVADAQAAHDAVAWPDPAAKPA